MRLKDKVIVVTGSTKGIGRGVVNLLASEGARVVVSGRNENEGADVVETITASGGKACFFKTDVSVAEECKKLINYAKEKYGRIDGLVNNAGIFPYYTMLETSEETFDNVMATNVKGAFFCTQQALTYMTEQKCGSIVNIGSTHWEIGADTLTAYSISKGALHTLTKHVSLHFAKYSIRCNWITVGWVLSPGEIQRVLDAGHDMEWLKDLGSKNIPSGSFQTAEDIAYACVYLLSDETKQVTGTDIEVTGGFRPV